MSPIPEGLPQEVHNETLISNVHTIDRQDPEPYGSSFKLEVLKKSKR